MPSAILKMTLHPSHYRLGAGKQHPLPADQRTGTTHQKQSGLLPLFDARHSAKAGLKYGRFHGDDRYTTRESERLLRLPMYYGLTYEDVDRISENIIDFFKA